MLKNYLKIWIRNVIKNKTYSLITISGLAIGLAVCILLLLYVQDELSYDNFHENGDRSYRLCYEEHPFHAPQTAELFADNFPEIEDYTRLLIRDNGIFQYEEKKFKERMYTYADAGFFRLFSFTFLKGNAKSALNEPNSIVISERIALKYFGNEEPIGKILILDNEDSYTVSGVIEDMPHNSHIRYDLIATLTNAEEVFGANMMAAWGWQNFVTYFLFNSDFSKSEFEAKSSQFLADQQNLPPNQKIPSLSLQALEDIHLYSSHFKNDIQPQNDITYVLIFSCIGVLILLIACFNYINLFTAQATNRANEIGIKKVIGASRKQLAGQFIGESFIILLLAFILSLLIVEISLPLFNLLTGKGLTFFSLLQMNSGLSILGILLVTGVIAASYPAYVLSSFQPVSVLKSKGSSHNSGFQFRKILVSAQFTIVIILIISAIFMLKQLEYLQNKKLGYDKELILVSEVYSFEDIDKFKALKSVLLQQSNILNVASASRIPSDDLNNWSALLPDGHTDWINMPIVHISHDYFETLGITAFQGRLFTEQMQTDTSEAIILNETAVKELGVQEGSVGAGLQNAWPYSKRKIIGIVKDFHFESLYETIRPTAFVVYYNECFKLIVKVQSSNTKKTIEDLQEICKSFYPDWMFEFHFLDQQLESIYQTDQRIFKLMTYFTGLAIFIACIGLFGLASFMIKSRTKEIGIRKVLGASISQILISLTQDFTKWILIANLIAWPVSWYAMIQWMENFAYSIELSWWMFAVGGVISLAITLVTVSFQAIKAAITNPVKSLKYE